MRFVSLHGVTELFLGGVSQLDSARAVQVGFEASGGLMCRLCHQVYADIEGKPLLPIVGNITPAHPGAVEDANGNLPAFVTTWTKL
jgi:hypothetical protein